MLHRFRKLLRLVRIAIKDFSRTRQFAKDHSASRDVRLSMLRTQSHILDKGLNIRDFEKGHGRGVYAKCTRLLSQISENGDSDPSLAWCKQVVENYELAQKCDTWTAVRKEIPVFGKADREVFRAIIECRVSCRDFLPSLITKEVWNEIVDQASLAPSACCRHSERFHIVSSRDLIDRLVPCVAGATGFSSPIPYLICVTADIRAYAVIDRFLPFIDGSLSTGYFLLACAVNDVSTTVLNWQHATTEQNRIVKQILGLPEYEEILMFIAAGRPQSLPERPARPAVASLMRMHN